MNIDVLNEFCIDTENSEKNYRLAEWYESQGHTASALTYYLRAAERGNSDTLEQKHLIYKALIHAAFCYRVQGSRDGTEKVLLEHALTFLPDRPEAYYFLAHLYERRKDWQNSYIYAALGLLKYLEKEPPCTLSWNGLVSFPGQYALIFQKAVSAWWWGKGMESRELFHLLIDNYWDQMEPAYRASVESNITQLGSGPESQAFHTYTKAEHKKLLRKFSGSDQIQRNFSQVYQDLFILAALKGKKNGTFVEIGGSYPFKGNNTALLEREFNWTGISIEYDEKFINDYKNNRSAKLFHDNALTVDYTKLLSENFSTKEIDYLQLDIEPAKNTYECMLKIPFDEYKFAVITYEHDYYVDVTRSFRKKSREFLESKGYVLVVNDVSPDGKSNFEDWWVHPDLVEDSVIQKLKSISEGTQHAKKYTLGEN